jgi:radical SAM superfamily enzyme YgiQ (UPF0313 family)
MPEIHDLHVTGSQQPITRLDNLPIPDRSLVDLEKYHRYIGQAMVKRCIALEATRGCPYRCTYCYQLRSGGHAYRSARHIFAEVKLYYDQGVRNFAFVDDIFNLNTRNSMRFFQLIIDNGLDLRLFFPAGLRGDILTREYIDLMVEAGTVNAALALETASPRLQKLIGKNLNIEILRENIDYFCSRHPGVILELFTMHGFPTETESEAMMTLDFIKSIKWLHFPYINLLRIFPHTRMEKIAIANGISPQAILQSQDLSYHELPETLPFDKGFTFEYQTTFIHEYFLLKERLLRVLPYQTKILSEDEMVQKYNSYLTAEIKSFKDLLTVARIEAEELPGLDFPGEEAVPVTDREIMAKRHRVSPAAKPDENALRVLLLDLSQYFSGKKKRPYDVVEAPLGLIYLMTYLKQQLGTQVEGKIAKSRIDFDHYGELNDLLEEFKPEVIGIRTLTFYKEFFHEAVANLRRWSAAVPIIAGGPYATCDYASLLQDPGIDLVVLGEGELTFCHLVTEIIKNKKKLPDQTILEGIDGIAFAARPPNCRPGN